MPTSSRVPASTLEKDSGYVFHLKDRQALKNDLTLPVSWGLSLRRAQHEARRKRKVLASCPGLRTQPGTHRGMYAVTRTFSHQSKKCWEFASTFTSGNFPHDSFKSCSILRKEDLQTLNEVIYLLSLFFHRSLNVDVAGKKKKSHNCGIWYTSELHSIRSPYSAGPPVS